MTKIFEEPKNAKHAIPPPSLPNHDGYFLLISSKNGIYLKFTSDIFYNFSLDDSLSKTMKSTLYFNSKALFLLEILNFLKKFSLPFPHFPDLKEQMKVK